ncbi:hypothetical protein R5R35_008406 [Gryllus longicercus]|uniref:Kazal-like domain-containing protein n=2 Tax=Gryllus longicercus TaxID=2509291 RepID=A0AAN9W4R6_9ORTH
MAAARRLRAALRPRPAMHRPRPRPDARALVHVLVLLAVSALVAAQNECRKCPKYYSPVCASDGGSSPPRVFVNYCEMNYYNCFTGGSFTKVRSGTCS